MKFYALLVLTFGFPFGVWMACLGYELPALITLFIGWAAQLMLALSNRPAEEIHVHA